MPRRVRIVPSGFFDRVYGRPESLPAPPLEEIEGVPLLFGKPVVERVRDTLVVHADLVASAYFLLTRYEEWIRPGVRDEHGRFPGKESLPYRAGFLDRPIVDEYGALLRRWAREMGIDAPEPKRKFSVLLTHDVDSLGRCPRWHQAAGPLVRAMLLRQRWNSAVRDALVSAGLRRHAHDNLADVLAMDRELVDRAPDRVRRLFFFPAGGEDSADPTWCRLSDRRVRRAMIEVCESGAEVALHASYEAGVRPQRIAGEKRRLEQVLGRPLSKNRHHFLAWRETRDGRQLRSAGITWDSTLGYADAVGFRLGTCRPVPLFDPAARELLDIEEHPLVVMDNTLSAPKYMGLGEKEAFDRVARLMEATRRHGGEFVMLWHNTRLAQDGGGYHRGLYARLLSHLAELLTHCGEST